MNERIKELLGQAYDEAVPETWTELSSIQLGRIYDKFAELIVRECAEISEQSQWSEAKGEYYEGFNEAMIYVSNKIKEHFGVEE
jgi:hypothetical protein